VSVASARGCDPTAAIAANADLVVWSRLGSSYSPAELTAALEDRTLLELRAMIRPSEDLALYRAEMAEWPGRGRLLDWQEWQRDWVTANDACRRDIVDRLACSGPLRSRDLPDTCKVPWTSTGWTNNRNVTRLLEFMVLRGEVAVAGRGGRDRLWDLAARVYPDDPPVPVDEVLRIRNERRLRALGIARARDRNVRSNRGTWARPANRPWSRASRARGASILPRWANRSRDVRDCCHRSIG
jgi:uncharacterized protein